MAAKFKTSLSKLTTHQPALAGFILHEPVVSTTGDRILPSSPCIKVVVTNSEPDQVGW